MKYLSYKFVQMTHKFVVSLSKDNRDGTTLCSTFIATNKVSQSITFNRVQLVAPLVVIDTIEFEVQNFMGVYSKPHIGFVFLYPNFLLKLDRTYLHQNL